MQSSVKTCLGVIKEMNWEVLPEFEFGPCKRIRIPGVREICAREIWNPELWNPEYSSRNPESH